MATAGLDEPKPGRAPLGDFINPLIGASASMKFGKRARSARLKARSLKGAWVRRPDIVNGGTLELEMGSEPDKRWVSAPVDQPPSQSTASL